MTFALNFSPSLPMAWLQVSWCLWSFLLVLLLGHLVILAARPKFPAAFSPRGREAQVSRTAVDHCSHLARWVGQNFRFKL